MLAWAAKTGAWIVEDDYDSEFRYRGHPLPALKSLDEADRVFYAGSFSKVLSPGLRLGYLDVPSSELNRFSRDTELFGPISSLLDQMVVADFMIDGHFARHLKQMRRYALVSTLHKVFGDGIVLDVPTGGMHVIGRFPGCRDDVLLASTFLRQSALRAKRTWSGCHEAQHHCGRWQLTHATARRTIKKCITREGEQRPCSPRAVLATAGSFALLAASKGPAAAAMGPNDKFDLVIKGGDVLDPSQNLRGKRDIGIRFGVIEALEADIPVERAQRVLDATGKLVTPGLVDLHTHIYPYGSAIGIPADELVAYQCTTTCVSAGDAGANNFAAFRRYVAGQTRTRVYAFVHIANIGLAGFPVAELYNIDFAQTDVATRAIAENSDMVLGAKVRMSENVIAKNGLEPLKRAISACENAGTGGKVMCHIGGVETRVLMSQILDLLRPGDILTHCYSGFPNLAGDFTNIVQDGRLLPAALAAKQRGVVFDIGHGGGSFDYTVAEAAIQQGCLPDTISSDIHVFSGNTPGMPYLTWVMSKFLGLGFSLEDVVAMATIKPATVINRTPKLGSLEVGAPGDVAIMDVVEGPVSFVDTRNNKREGKVHLKPVQTVAAGVPFGRPYNAPFAVR